MHLLKTTHKNIELIKIVVNICVATLLCGQFGFRVATYFLDGIRPSFPFWILLYLCTIVAFYAHRAKLNLLYYTAHIFFIYIIIYCLYYSNGNYDFLINFIIYCTIPYLCGILIGRYISDLFLQISFSLFDHFYGINIMAIYINSICLSC